MKNQKILKIVPEYKTPYLRKYGGIKVTGSAINVALFQGE